MLLIYLLMAVVGVLAMIFAVQNPGPVQVRFLHWRIADLPLSLVILFSAIIGVICAAVSGFAQQLRLKLKIRQLERRIAQLSDAPEKSSSGAPGPDTLPR
jgi:lipopolysaccharide assembly protein A